MAQAQISWGSVAVGTLIGAGIAYALVTRQQKAKKAEAKEPDRVIPPLPPAPDGLGTGDGRRPMPDTQVWIPQTPADRTQLDGLICDVWGTFEPTDTPGLDELMLAVLNELAPEVSWPTVPGDHASLPSLQAIVAYRIDQIGQRSKTSSVADNFDAFCIESVTPPIPTGPGGLVG